LTGYDTVLCEEGLYEYGYFLNDDFMDTLYYYDDGENYIPDPYLDKNIFNKKWLTPN